MHLKGQGVEGEQAAPQRDAQHRRVVGLLVRGLVRGQAAVGAQRRRDPAEEVHQRVRRIQPLQRESQSQQISRYAGGLLLDGSTAGIAFCKQMTTRCDVANL